MRRIAVCLVVLWAFLFSLVSVGIDRAFAAQQEKPKPLELDETEWGIQLTYVPETGKPKISEDLLIFAEGKFNSKNYENKKFDATNYTLSVREDGATVFETMQTKGEDKAFWTGEIRGKGIRGILSYHPQNGKVEDYAFVGGLSKGFIGAEREAAKKAAEEEAARKAAELAAKAAQEAKQKAAAAALEQQEASGAAGAVPAEESSGEDQGWWQKVTGGNKE